MPDPEDQEKQDENSSNSKKKTEFLNLPQSSKPMEDRTPQPGTAILTGSWRLRLQINDQVLVVPITPEMVVGRIIDPQQEASIEVDLTPYGAYHFGVSRRHARFSMHDGYLYVEDLGSMNGTRINGFQLTPNQKYRVRDGDELEFARLRTHLRFERPKV